MSDCAIRPGYSQFASGLLVMVQVIHVWYGHLYSMCARFFAGLSATAMEMINTLLPIVYMIAREG